MHAYMRMYLQDHTERRTQVIAFDEEETFEPSAWSHLQIEHLQFAS